MLDGNVNSEFEASLKDRQCQADKILNNIKLIKIEGISKLRNKIKQEVEFLNKISKNSIYNKEHLLCSNLKYLQALADELIRKESSCTGVMSVKLLTDEFETSRKLCIDLILQGGLTWMKVIARNPKSLTLLSAGGGCYGQKNIVEQAEQFLECAKQNPLFYKTPTVVFHFAYGIESALAKELEELGIVVDGFITDGDCTKEAYFEDYEKSERDLTCPPMVKCPIPELDIALRLPLLQPSESPRLNLCVSTLLAYVSSLTNGGSHRRFQTKILNDLAQWERAHPVKPLLDQLFQGRQLYCCHTAMENFQEILTTLGGPGERERAESFVNRITIVEDSLCEKIPIGGRTKYRTLAIFGTSERLQAITVTANHAFLRSAMSRGVHFPAILHESRALTEGKELPENGS